MSILFFITVGILSYSGLLFVLANRVDFMTSINPIAVHIDLCTQMVDLVLVSSLADATIQRAQFSISVPNTNKIELDYSKHDNLVVVDEMVGVEINKGHITYILTSTQREWLQNGQSKTVSSLIFLIVGAGFWAFFFFAIGIARN